MTLLLPLRPSSGSGPGCHTGSLTICVFFSLCQCRVLVSFPPNWVCLGRAGPAWTSEPWKVTHDPVKLARLGAAQWPDHSLASVLTGDTRSSWPISGFRQPVYPELLFHVFCTALRCYLLFPGIPDGCHELPHFNQVSVSVLRKDQVDICL